MSSLAKPTSQRQTVRDAMITSAVVHGPGTTAAELRAFFRDDHVHSALIVDQGQLVAVVDRGDLGSVDDARAIDMDA